MTKDLVTGPFTSLYCTCEVDLAKGCLPLTGPLDVHYSYLACFQCQVINYDDCGNLPKKVFTVFICLNIFSLEELLFVILLLCHPTLLWEVCPVYFFLSWLAFLSLFCPYPWANSLYEGEGLIDKSIGYVGAITCDVLHNTGSKPSLFQIST